MFFLRINISVNFFFYPTQPRSMIHLVTVLLFFDFRFVYLWENMYFLSRPNEVVWQTVGELDSVAAAMMTMMLVKH